MTYPFVKAFYDFGPRPGPARAFVVHMAEGGGTVGYLAKAQPNRVSVHYVIERTGRIVQMLGEDRVSGSINPSDLRTTDDKAPPMPPFGVTAAKAVLGDGWRDPNRHVISLEIEGFAATGPNTAQVGSLRTLVRDVRSRHPSIGLLGHRDFADYKACPGKLIPWDQLGGHGPATEAADVIRANFKATLGLATTTRAASAFDYETGAPRPVPSGYARNVVAEATLAEQLSPSLPAGEPMLVTTFGSPDRLELLRVADTDWKGPAVPVADCADEVRAATAPLQKQLTTQQARIRTAVTALGGTL